MFLLTRKFFYRREATPAFNVHDLAIHKLGLNASMRTTDLKKCINHFAAELLKAGVIVLPQGALSIQDAWIKLGKGQYTIAFHRESYEARPMVPYLIDKQIDRCAWIHGTELVVCSRNPIPALAAIGGRPVPLPFSELVLSIKARKIVTANGSIDAALAVARDHAKKAGEALAGADALDAEVTGGLCRLVDGLVARDR